MGERYDAVIVGAGIMGCAIALELARKGWRTLNVDALPAAGYGSTSASAAVIRVYYSTLSGTVLAYEGYHYWRHWREHLDLPADEELARFVETGSVVIKTEENRHLRPVCALMERLGIPFEDWDAPRLKRELPFYDLGRYAPPRRPEDPAFGESSGEIAGAVMFPSCGYVSDPQLAARNLQRAAERRGARFRFNAKVMAIRSAAGRVQGVTLADGTAIDAAVVVNAAGPHSAVINRMAGVEADMGVSTRPLRQEVAYVPAPPGVDFSRRGLVCADGDVGCYWRSDIGNKLLIGGLEPACDPLEWVDPDDWNRELTEQWTAQVYRTALRIPTLPIPSQASGVAALYDVSDDWIPIYDRSSLKGYYMAVGTSGNQFKNAPLVGVLMAELIQACEQGLDHDREPLKLEGRYTGLTIDMGFFSRLRSVNRDSSFSVLG
ncbi:NAD(P)/FAD-dependent oxidoreductase [Benzoatithermus flavus]|uniref:FAD-dependent oxidoreductase n=1 Tax=Benzoatithermus flavus TaxID=3108223 RepID=A0ABU8XZ11_9PROT